MRFDVVTLFPGFFAGPLNESILKRAIAAGIIEVRLHNLREFGDGRRQVVDDAPFGGGDGMVMKPDVLVAAARAAKAAAPDSPVALLTPQGQRLDQALARQLAQMPGLILLCGHYAGVDERAREMVAEMEISIGDYVLSGGEAAALVVIDAVSRQVPGVLGNEDSPADDSFPARLEYPQYTRPAEFEGRTAPEALLSGHHERVRRWRKKESLRRTLARRPDLIALHPLDEEERELLAELEAESGKD